VVDGTFSGFLGGRPRLGFRVLDSIFSFSSKCSSVAFPCVNSSVRWRRDEFRLIGDAALLFAPAVGMGVPFNNRGRLRLLPGVVAVVSSSSADSLSGTEVVIVLSPMRRTVGD
jgi:hypothetical protein